jgi:CheY-like chemotaxis protein
LVTDDSEMMRVLISDMLESEGAHVEAVENGLQALDALHRQGQGFDIVLIDVQMPVMDGISTLREIRADPALSQQPVVAITAGLPGTEGETLRKLGVRSLLFKPIKIDPLVRACQMAVATSPESFRTPENSCESS